ncbi:molybdenum cofactor guanylyltransferase [Blastococcus sp. Marseille-P5729]|uniref:molybdenum cofactor guanylyltransferase n=1 Tax=Blastococcus sp. Marseille-P5729 TaxID=2086582 RepID=UPI000D10689D|nr:NTP transferase domain-containing protein [Blastococcus sp. Marseille-P5729]
MPATPSYDAIVLAGGEGSRLGGVDKAQLDLAGSPLIARPLAACADAERVVIVGPENLRQLAGRVTVTREDPPGGGPAAGTAAGLAQLGRGGAEWIILLSCDLPRAEAGVRRLLDAAHQDHEAADGYCLTDSEGRLQWLFGGYRRDALLRAVEECAQPAGTSMRRLLRTLRLTAIPTTDEISGDLDTWEDHAAWTARLENTP